MALKLSVEQIVLAIEQLNEEDRNRLRRMVDDLPAPSTLLSPEETAWMLSLVPKTGQLDPNIQPEPET